MQRHPFQQNFKRHCILDGNYIKFNGKRLAICDPTYIGAPVEATMPDMDNKTAKVIVVK